jgi:short-subunit dehydrogenase
VNLEGKRILITGGSSGIGMALARCLLGKGAKVVITGRRPEVLARATQELQRHSQMLWSVAADVATSAGRRATLKQAMSALSGLDVLVNNAGGVRAGRLENTSEAELKAMLDVDLIAPVLLTRAALPALRKGGEAMIVNIASVAALVGMPFYSTYGAAKAGLARFGEGLRRELKGEGVHVLNVYPAGTDTPMMRSNRAGPELGFSLEPAEVVAKAIIQGMETNALEVIRGDDIRKQMIALNQTHPAAIDERMMELKAALEEAVQDHSAL